MTETTKPVPPHDTANTANGNMRTTHPGAHIHPPPHMSNRPTGGQSFSFRNTSTTTIPYLPHTRTRHHSAHFTPTDAAVTDTRPGYQYPGEYTPHKLVYYLPTPRCEENSTTEQGIRTTPGAFLAGLMRLFGNKIPFTQTCRGASDRLTCTPQMQMQGEYTDITATIKERD